MLKENHQEGKKDNALSRLFAILNCDGHVMAQSSPLSEDMYVSFASLFRSEAGAHDAENALNQLGYKTTRSDRIVNVGGSFPLSEVQELAKSFALFENLLKNASEKAARARGSL